MEVDHILIFTEKAEEVAAALNDFGLSEGSPNVHAGQGTACRRFFFKNAYIEFAWVINEEEVKHRDINNMKLWERSQHTLTGYCPFGLCLRLNNPAKDALVLIFEDGWRYYSRFLPEGQFANIAANENFLAEPLLFEMPFFGIAPQNYPLQKQQPLTHEKGFIEITKVTLTLPVAMEDLSDSMKKVKQQSIVEVTTGEHYAVAIAFDNATKGETQSFDSLIPLTFTW